MSSCCWTSKLWKYFHADKLALSSMCAKITKIFQIFRNILKINLKCDFFTLHLQRLLHPLLSPSLKFRAAAKNAFLETHICWCVVIFAILRILILRLIDRGCWHDWQVGTEIIFQSRTNEFYLICWVDQMKSWRRVIVWLCDDTHLASKI